MALGALISAYQEGTQPGAELRATLPLAGRTLVEYQARLARGAGASPIVLLVERMPPSLISAVERLVSDGVAVQLARGPAEAAAYFVPDDDVLVFAGGLFADAASVDRVAEVQGPAILTLAENIGLDGFERIDAAHRWAGLAMASGAQLTATSAMLGDWDLQSTLLRRLIQDGARQIAAESGPGAPLLLMASGTRDLDDAERRIVAAARGARGDWVERHITPILEEFAVEQLMTTRVRPQWLLASALGLTALGAFFFASGWFGAGVIALLISVPLDGMGDRLGALRMQPLPRADPMRRALPYAAAAALAALALRLSQTGGGWGCIATLAAAFAFFHAGSVEAGSAGERPSWLASRKGCIVLAAPFAAVGSWTGGLVAAALYAGASFLWLQRLNHHRTRRKVSKKD